MSRDASLDETATAERAAGRSHSTLYVRAGSRLMDDRIAYSFRFPLTTEVRILPDGGLFSMRARSLLEESYMVQLSTFRIRDEKALSALPHRISFPCPLDPPPASGNFRIQKECTGEVEGNSLVRWIVLERHGELLHLLYLSVRQRERKTGLAILAEMKENPATTAASAAE